MNNIKVMIIEDDPMVSHLNRKFTEKIQGFEVINEINIDNNMRINKNYYKKADLLLLDIYLPGKNGIKLLKEIRNLSFDIDVIIISASKDTKHINDSMHLGAVDYLIKPFNFQRFRKSLIDYKKYFINIKLKKDNMTQKELDLLMGKNNDIKLEDKTSLETSSLIEEREVSRSFIRDLPKGLNKETLNIIEQFLKNSDKALSTKKIAKKLELSRVTIQRYLKYMANNKIVEINRKFGKVGRPKHFYSLTKSENDN